MKRFLFSLLIGLLLHTGNDFTASAQCAMCKANAESSLKEGKTNAKSLNMGIMYLLVMPYLLVGGIGYYWYINNRKKEQLPEQESDT